MEEITKKGNLYTHSSGKFRIRERKGRAYEYELASMPGIWKSTGEKDIEKAVAAVLGTPEGILIRGASEGITLYEFAKDFFSRTDEDSQQARDRLFGKALSADSYMVKQGILRNHILPKFGNYRLDAITSNAVESWYICLGPSKGDREVLSTATRIRVLDTFSQVMDDARRKRLIPSNPCKDVERVSVKTEKPRRIFSDVEVRKFFPPSIDQTIAVWGSARNALFFSIMLDTGFRPCEIAALSESSFCNGGIYADEDVNPRSGLIQKRIKTTDKGARCKAMLVSGYTIGLLERHREDGGIRDGYLFMDKDGKFRISKTTVSIRIIEKAAERAGILLDGRTAYSFRHTFYTRMMASLGEDDLRETDVQFMMGHVGYRPEYDHRTPEQLIERLKKVSGIVEATRR